MDTDSINWADSAGLPQQIWLASKSPRRKQLIQTLGLDAEVFLTQHGEQAEALEHPLDDEPPLEYVERVTRLKLQTAIDALSAQQKTGVVLAADTTVARGSEILGKPADAEQAMQMLRSLSDQSHHVHTCVAVANLRIGQDIQVHLRTQTSEVHFGRIPEEFMTTYIESGQPFDKAGGYGIQGVIGQFITRINGSHSGIMGLPLFETALLLREAVQP